MSSHEEYKALSTLLEEVMSERTKKQLEEYKTGWDDSDKELIDVVFKAGWIASTMDCGHESLEKYMEWKEYHEYIENEA